MKKLMLLAVCSVLMGAVLMGCHREPAFQNMSRAEQQKIMQGDPQKTEEMKKRMVLQYGGPNSPSRPANAGAPQSR